MTQRSGGFEPLPCVSFLRRCVLCNTRALDVAEPSAAQLAAFAADLTRGEAEAPAYGRSFGARVRTARESFGLTSTATRRLGETKSVKGACTNALGRPRKATGRIHVLPYSLGQVCQDPGVVSVVTQL